LPGRQGARGEGTPGEILRGGSRCHSSEKCVAVPEASQDPADGRDADVLQLHEHVVRHLDARDPEIVVAGAAIRGARHTLVSSGDQGADFELVDDLARRTQAVDGECGRLIQNLAYRSRVSGTSRSSRPRAKMSSASGSS